MSTVRIRSAFRVSLCLLLAGLLAPFCVTGEVTAPDQIEPLLQCHQRKHDRGMGGARAGPIQKTWAGHAVHFDAAQPLAVAALIAGEIDAAIIGPGHLVNAGLSGADLIGIANFHQKLDYRLNSRPDIKKAEDLRGKRVAISGPGSTSHLVTLLALQGLNIDPTQARIAFLTIPGTEINRRLALESGGVDATSLRGAVGDLYGNKGYNVLYNLKTTGATLPQNMLVTTRRTAAAKPQVIEAYLKTMIEAIAVTLDPANKELVMRLLVSNLRLTNPGDAEESYLAVINSYERAPHTSLEGMKRLQVLLTQINPKIAEVRVENLIDNSFMNKLESSGYIQSVYKN